METIRDFDNRLLNRREVSLMIKSNTNPGFENSLKSIVEKFEAAEELIVVNNIYGKFGSNEFVIEAFIYSSPEDKNKLEKRKKEAKPSK